MSEGTVIIAEVTRLPLLASEIGDGTSREEKLELRETSFTICQLLDHLNSYPEEAFSKTARKHLSEACQHLSDAHDSVHHALRISRLL